VDASRLAPAGTPTAAPAVNFAAPTRATATANEHRPRRSAAGNAERLMIVIPPDTRNCG
jgi:hypothetical protein